MAESTGLYTRPYMIQYLGTAVNQASDPVQVAGIMMDIDSFKSINDTFGHLTGDDAIENTGKLLLGVISKNGIAARYAGDEFVVILKIKSKDEITSLIQRIEKATEEFNASSQKQYKLSFSFGYSIYEKNDTTDEFLGRMDRAMYNEKHRKYGNLSR